MNGREIQNNTLHSLGFADILYMYRKPCLSICASAKPNAHAFINCDLTCNVLLVLHNIKLLAGISGDTWPASCWQPSPESCHVPLPLPG